LALGSHALTPLQMATGYATFANGGYKVDAHLISHIENERGEVVYQTSAPRVCRECERADIARRQFAPEETLEDISLEAADNQPAQPIDTTPYAPRIMDERIAYLIDSILKDVITRGTGRRAREL